MDPNIDNVLRMHFGAAYEGAREQIAAAARLAGDREMHALVQLSNRDENLPRLQRYDSIGRRTEKIVFHPSYHEVGRRCWKTGVLSSLASRPNDLLSGALVYFLDHHGEGGHACPIACAAGLIKLLQQLGTEEQQERLLPALLNPDYEQRLHAAQFVTEVQGGSDVGANACVATPAVDEAGSYRISGEKWFCSVVDAGIFVVSARLEGAPVGTKGLGLFLVPRQVGDSPNSFTIRRLKEKLGTQSMASAEVDFDGAWAEPIGPLDKGFKNLASIVLDTSRVHNALASCGMMRRATLEAHTFARHRRAFGGPIIEQPMVQETLARMRVIASAAVASTFRLLALSDRLESEPDGNLARARRVSVNINKYWTSVWATRVVRDGIEVLGGNGTIEDFSVLPRLYRDAMVMESWEGTHNALCAQVLRDFATRGLHRPWCAEIKRTLNAIECEGSSEPREYAEGLHQRVKRRIGQLLASDEETARLHIRRVVDEMCHLQVYVAMLVELAWERKNGVESDKDAILELYRYFFIEGVVPFDDSNLPRLVREVSGRL